MIGQALADDTLKQPVGTVGVVAVERRAVAVAEIKLGDITVKVLRGAPLVHAAHPALEDRIVALDGVGMDATTPVTARAVVDATVP